MGRGLNHCLSESWQEALWFSWNRRGWRPVRSCCEAISYSPFYPPWEAVMKQFLLVSGFWWGVGLSTPFPSERCQNINPLYLVSQQWCVQQISVQLSIPFSFNIFFFFLVCGTRIAGNWHLWLNFLFIVYVSNKLSRSVNGSLYLHWLNQSSLGLGLANLVCLLDSNRICKSSTLCLKEEHEMPWGIKKKSKGIETTKW